MIGGWRRAGAVSSNDCRERCLVWRGVGCLLVFERLVAKVAIGDGGSAAGYSACVWVARIAHLKDGERSCMWSSGVITEWLMCVTGCGATRRPVDLRKGLRRCAVSFSTVFSCAISRWRFQPNGPFGYVSQTGPWRFVSKIHGCCLSKIHGCCPSKTPVGPRCTQYTRAQRVVDGRLI